MTPLDFVVFSLIALVIGSSIGFLCQKNSKVQIASPSRKKDVIFVGNSDSNDMKFSIDVIGRNGGEDRLWQRGVFIIAKTHLALYKEDNDVPILHVPADSLRGYFHHDSEKQPLQMWIHIESYHFWYLIKIQFTETKPHLGFHKCLRSIEFIVPNALILAYRMDMPYIHLGSAFAQEVNADDEGWVLEDSVQLFLTPIYLVVMNESGFVLYKIQLSSISDIHIAHVLEERGIIRMTVDGAYQSFAIQDYQRWANLLSTAIRKVHQMKVI